MKAKILGLATFILALAAAIISYNLTVKHVSGTSGATWFEAGCSDSQEPGAANCAAVLASPHAYLPPKHEGGTGRFHIPVAFLGLLYYTTLAVWMIGVGVPSRNRGWLHALPTALVALGLLGSAYFLYVMFSKMGQWCPWCLVTHVLNLLIAVCVVLMWPVVRRRPGVAVHTIPSSGSVPSMEEEPARGLAVIPVPSTRTLLMTIVAIVGINYAHLNMISLKEWRRQAVGFKSDFDTCLAMVNKVRGNPELLLAGWRQGRAHEIARRADDPVRVHGDPGGATPLDVVIFSDFECPSCQRFEAIFAKQVVPLFPSGIRLTFKHYPIDKTCNPVVGASSHPHACEAARWAEAARVLGGNEAFWKAHDYLFEHRDSLAAGSLTMEAFAQAIGLEQQQVVENMSSPSVNQRIQEDAHLARAVGVSGTPAVFVDGRLVDAIAKGEIGFWAALAESRRNANGNTTAGHSADGS